MFNSFQEVGFQSQKNISFLKLSGGYFSRTITATSTIKNEVFIRPALLCRLSNIFGGFSSKLEKIFIFYPYSEPFNTQDRLGKVHVAYIQYYGNLQ